MCMHLHLLTVNMKNSSTNTAPNGRMPAIRDLCLKAVSIGRGKINKPTFPYVFVFKQS